MLAYAILGATYGFAAAAQPGQLQAFLLARTATHGWKATAPAALAPLLSDAPIVALVLLVLTHVPAAMVVGLRLVGGVFLLYLACGAFSAWRDYHAPDETEVADSRKTLMQATFVNLLNPGPYLAWSTVLGPLLIEAWHRSAGAAGAVVGGFYATMVLGTLALIVVFALAHSVGPRVARTMVGVSAAALVAFGGYQLWAGITGLRALGVL